MTEPSLRPAPFVLVVELQGTVEHYPLRQGRSVVGRAAGCDVVLDDASISRQHALLTVMEDQLLLVDLGSRNHTFVNGTQIERRDVAPGDTIMFGSVEATIRRNGDAAQSAAKPSALRRLKDFSDGEGSAAIDSPRLIRLLAEVAQTLVGTLTLSEMLSRVVDLLFANIRAERACLLMVQPGRTQLVPVLVRQAGRDTTDKPAISQTAVDTAVRQQAAIIAVDAQTDVRFDEAASVQFNAIRSLMCAPLIAADRLIGVLYVDNGLANQFKEADLDVFTALANYAAVAVSQAALSDQLAEERRRRERLQRYHSPAVVERILSHEGGELVLGAQEVEISVLFADIVEFTAMAETMPPQAVADLLNTFFSRAVDAIFAEHGTVDKFIGDAVLAVFGAPVMQLDHASRAVRAAQAMRHMVAEMNAERRFPPLRVRYAVNSGVAIAGDIGPTKRQDYTVLGDVVNTASRLKTLAHADQLVVSRATYDRITPAIQATPLGEFSVRGRAGKLEVLAIAP